MRALPAILLALLAAPAAAQVRGQCVDGTSWWAEGRVAALGPCEAPEEAFLVLACDGGAITAETPFPFGVAPDEPVSTTLDVDGRSFALEGRGTPYPATDVVGLGGAVLPEGAAEALAAGRQATLATAAGPVEIHLSGSGAAIAAMRAACGG